ncbi:MAG: molybdopterin molybdotransferase MoeA [Candidatus Hadarchaeales archaeon]
MSVRGRGFKEYLPWKQALKIVLSNVRSLSSESVSLRDAVGRVLAEDVVAKRDVPPFNRSAVDGFAVVASDTFRASPARPVKLRVIGKILPGSRPRCEVSKGKAVKIATGAPLPPGADSVIPLEQAKAVGEMVEIYAPVTPGKNVSKRGEDVKAGERILEKGRTLRPQDVGLLAAVGCSKILVVRKPRVAIISTGKEIVDPLAELRSGELPDIDSFSLLAAVKEAGGIPEITARVGDDVEEIKESIERAIRNDAVVISGGTSVGERDFVPRAISEIGKLLFHGVSLRPGGPAGFGLVRGKPVFSLPGFPVAALISFRVLVQPALNLMQGRNPEYGKITVRARVTRDVASSLGRADVVRVKISEKGEAEPIMSGGSGILTSMTSADGFFIIDERKEGVKKGEVVKVELF